MKTGFRTNLTSMALSAFLMLASSVLASCGGGGGGAAAVVATYIGAWQATQWCDTNGNNCKSYSDFGVVSEIAYASNNGFAAVYSTPDCQINYSGTYSVSGSNPWTITATLTAQTMTPEGCGDAAAIGVPYSYTLSVTSDNNQMTEFQSNYRANYVRLQ
ncbi:MAG: hypothetical protein HY804_11630 [Nitrospinae bacterium]|nr:hypothetical protein [Nitrospinota bacterium]